VIHGGPGAAGSMEPVARRLGQSRGVLEPLQTATTLDGQIEELRLILEQHADWPVILVGHSWGAWLSWIVAARYTQLLRKLVLVASGPFEGEYAAAIADNRLRRLSLAEQREYLDLCEKLKTPAPENENGPRWSRLGELTHKADSYDLIIQPCEPTLLDLTTSPADIYQGVWPAANNLRSSGELLKLAVNISCPVLAIHGDCDPHPAEGVREPLSAHVAHFRMIVLANCGHYPWHERHARDRFFQILENEHADAL
jgi:pimeloyl-ACP methyl ester carboxylesterase